LRKFLLLLLLLVSANSFADTYTYYSSRGGATSSAQSNCLAAVASQFAWFSGARFGCSVVYSGGGDYVGNGTADGPDGGHYDTQVFISRRGDSCEEGSVLDEPTGSCKSVKKDGDKCDDQTGGSSSNPMIWQSSTSSCVAFSTSNDDATCGYLGSLNGGAAAFTVKGVWDGGVPTAPPSFTDNATNCEMSTISTTECTTDVPGNVTCNVTGKLTGKATSKPQAPDIKDSGCPASGCQPLLPASTANSNPCVYTGTASASTCTSEQETQKDGKQDCGSVNGKFTCIYQQPSSNGIKIVTDVKTTTAPDGSKTSVKTDNATKTTCTDVKKCSTSTSTTTTTTKTNSSGVSTSTSSTCTGKCGANGTGLESGGGTGTGTDNGTGGSGDEEGSGGNAGSLKDPENGSFDPQAAEWDEKLTKAKTDFKDSLTKLKSAFDPIGSTNLGAGGGHLPCPPTVTVLGKSIGFCVTEYETSLGWLGSAIYAVFAVMALLIIFL